MKIKWLLGGVGLALVLLVMVTGLGASHASRAEALGGAFTYQGQLKSSGEPFTGSCDFVFGLWDSLSEGAQVGAPQTKDAVAVEGGLFTVQLDFGLSAFNGDARWLEIAVRCPEGSGDYTTLAPRQALTAAPYASYALAAPWSGLSGAPAGFADGVDNDTTYTAGDGLALTGTEFSADTAVMQALVDGTCDAGSAIRVINADGSVTCQPLWTLTGNAVNAEGTLGTTTDFPLNFIVNGSRALRLEPHGTSPNLIGGYSGNSVNAGVWGATISGGGYGEGVNTVSKIFGTIGGGRGNTASGNFSSVGGGDTNTASGQDATVGGGYGNEASGSESTIGGGQANLASQWWATVGGGYFNTASGEYSTVPGGLNNLAQGSYSLAAGRNAKANNDGCFVWGDSVDSDVTCDVDNRWVARATGGVYFYTNGLLTSGSYISTGGSGWNNVSSRELKENFTPVDTAELLDRLGQMEITTWNYKAQGESIIHVGLMADEFNALIEGLGGEGQDFINTMDANGVALAAIQGLIAENQELKDQIATLTQDTQALEARLAKLEENAGVGSASQAAAGLPLTGVLFAGVIACAGIWGLRRGREARL